MEKIKGVILDYNRTIYDPDRGKLMEGAKELLEYCKDKNIKLSLISRGYPTRDQEIEDLGIKDYFTKIIRILKEQDEQKAPHHFQESVDAMGLVSSEVVAVGDRVAGEIKCANSLGMTTIWFKNGKYANTEPTNDDERPDKEVLQLKEVIGLL
jgi:putative hydrolase of the HAD superfamily